MRKFVVIGGDAAGMSAAAAIRRADPTAEITVFEKTEFVSYGECGIPFYISGEVKDYNSLIVYTPEYFKTSRKIDVFTKTPVEKIDTASKKVFARNIETGKEIEAEYNKLILAAGATSKETVKVENVFRVKDLTSAIKLKKFLDEKKPKSVIVVGSGFLGLEMCEAFRKLGMEVFLSEIRETVLPQFDREISKVVKEELEKNKVKIINGPSKILPRDGKFVLQQGLIEFVADFVMDCTGFSPAVELTLGTSIKTGKTGAITVNEHLQTTDPSVYAAGDCIEVKQILTGEKIYLPLGTTANKTGRIAGINAADGSEIFEGVLGTSGTKVFSIEVVKTGLGEEEAKEFFPDVETCTSKSFSRAHYYPGGKEIITKLIFQKSSRILLGAQQAGGECAKRIDIFATAIYNKMTLKGISQLDLVYNPSFAPTWDPVIRAASKCLQ